MKFSKFLLCLSTFIFLSACSSVALTPTATNTVAAPTATTQPTQTSLPTETVTPEATATQEVTYTVCKTPDFLTCPPLTHDDLFAMTSGGYTKFAQWYHDYLAQPFDAGQLDTRPWGTDSGGVTYVDPTKKRVPGTVSMHANITAGVYMDNGITYAVLPFEVPDETAPNDSTKNIPVTGVCTMNYIKNGVFTGQDVASDLKMKTDSWLKVKVPPLDFTANRPNTMGVHVSLAAETIDAVGQATIDHIVSELGLGHTSALRLLRGMPVQVDCGAIDDSWYTN